MGSDVKELAAGEEMSLTEKQFSQQVVDLALTFGWKVYHPWISIHSSAGFPDLTMAREERLIFAELKSEKGKLTEAQAEWLRVLKATGNKVFEWRPHQFDEIAGILQRDV